MDSEALFVQEFETADFALFDLAFRLVLGTVIDTVDIISWCRDLFETFRSVITREGFVTTLAVDVEGKIFDHIRL